MGENGKFSKGCVLNHYNIAKASRLLGNSQKWVLI